MATFQTITMTVAIVLLVICLLFIGVALYNNKYNMQFPPVIADCPDYWLDISQGDETKCFNKMSLGSSSCSKTMNFSGPFWKGIDGLCRKSQWARKCHLTWDGITNNLDACSNISR